LHIDNGTESVIFDSGRSEKLLENLRYLGLDRKSPVFIALSHGHYDHCNGAPALRRVFPQAQWHFNPQIRAPKWILDTNGWRYGGLPSDFYPAPSFHSGFQELIPGIYASGHVITPQIAPQNPRYFRNATGTLQGDDFSDEQVLLVHTVQGLSIISGCMHCGLAATIARARELFPAVPFYALVGGLHLSEQSSAQFAPIADLIQTHKFQKIMPLHCTGQDFINYIRINIPKVLSFGETGCNLEV
jgi:7,8-dihydropterin-6-yl-methyl-4-(beta-D-ribofuranosyl)aminobenzene 5'-phosphate synthase